MSKNLGQINLTITLAKLTAQRVIRRKSTWFWMVVGLMPCAVLIIWVLKQVFSDLSVTIKPYGFFTFVESFFILSIYLPLLSFFMGLGTINDEIESRNITFTLVRPLSRTSIALGRYLGHLIATVLIITIVTTGNYMANMLFQVEDIIGKLPHLLNGILVLSYGAAAFLAVISVMGAIARKFTIIGGILWIALDFGLSIFPAVQVQTKSIRYHMLSGFYEAVPQLGVGANVPEGLFFNGLFTCLIIALISCLCLSWRLRREIILSGGAQ